MMVKLILKKIICLLIAFIFVYFLLLSSNQRVNAETSYEEYWDAEAFANRNGYTFLKEVRPEWETNDQEDKTIIVTFKTNKNKKTQQVDKIVVQHTKGYQTDICLTVESFTEQEITREHGIEVAARVSVVKGSVGGGGICGSAESTSNEVYKGNVIKSTTASKKVTLYATVVMEEFYLYVYTLHRTVNKDKKGNVTGYSNFYMTVDNSLTGKYYDFDFASVNFYKK